MIYKVNINYHLNGNFDVDANSPEHAQYLVDNGGVDNSGKKIDKLMIMLKTVLEMIAERNCKPAQHLR